MANKEKAQLKKSLLQAREEIAFLEREIFKSSDERMVMECRIRVLERENADLQDRNRRLRNRAAGTGEPRIGSPM